MEAAPTGCYKCGRPGHWSRDCPFSPSNPDSSSSHKPTPAGDGAPSVRKPADKPKKLPRSRPKLTPDLLLSDDGLGYVLRYFPRAFKYRGRGNEVRDLGNLLELYCEWHSRLLPYYSFNQFIHKVEQVGTTKRVKTCLRELRERVANGGDPTRLREHPVEHDFPADNAETGEASHQEADVFPESQNAENTEEDILNEVFEEATAEPSQFIDSIAETSNGVSNSGTKTSGKAEITEEQRTRMEANRLKALERRAARAPSSQAT
ncbi:chromosome segregation in meiosis protein 3 [Neltuma alba]|uniref:chromosome segregation in meiosis protein 3 n=1 Tax=Neltuma alba TaxID=207710 RepID=UPI0010A4C4B6|nr:chromosome segregation in meiosis protein 3-like [Prosopis alba]